MLKEPRKSSAKVQRPPASLGVAISLDAARKNASSDCRVAFSAASHGWAPIIAARTSDSGFPIWLTFRRIVRLSCPRGICPRWR